MGSSDLSEVLAICSKVFRTPLWLRGTPCHKCLRLTAIQASDLDPAQKHLERVMLRQFSLGCRTCCAQGFGDVRRRWSVGTYHGRFVRALCVSRTCQLSNAKGKIFNGNTRTVSNATRSNNDLERQKASERSDRLSWGCAVNIDVLRVRLARSVRNA